MRRLILLLSILPALALAQLSGPPLNSPAVPGNGLFTGTGPVVLQASPTINTATLTSPITVTLTTTGTAGTNWFGSNGVAGFWINTPTGNTITQGINNGAITVVSSTGLAITGTLTASAVASSTAAQTGYLCYNTSGGVITYDPSLTCLASREELKLKSGPITDGLKDVMALRPFWGRWRDDSPNTDKEEQPFLGARYTARVDPRLATFDPAGEPLGVRYMNLTAVLVAAVQEQQRQINRLRRQLKQLRAAR